MIHQVVGSLIHGVRKHNLIYTVGFVPTVFIIFIERTCKMSITKEELDKYIKAYSEGKPLISDEEYDVLLEEYLKEHGESKRPFLRQQQSSAVNDVVGTLPKVYGITTPMRDGQKVYTDWLRTNKIENKTICVQPKLDGCSVALDVATGEYFTRGDYDNGISVNLTELFRDRKIHYEPEYFKSIKYEAVMSDEIFVKMGFNEKYDRPLDAVNAIFTSRNIQNAQFITLIPLREYHVDGKQLIPTALRSKSMFLDSNDFDEIQTFIDTQLENGAKVGMFEPNEHYAIDGVVVSVVDTYGEHDIPYVSGQEVAIKILKDINTTKLLDVTFQFGKSGRITPVAIVEPVMFGKRTITNITLSTFDRVIEMGLKYNDTVSVMYNIVPYLLDSKHDGDIPIQLPTRCPYCNHVYDLSVSGIIKCKNKDCVGLKLGSIIRYCEKMNMYGVSKGIITRLYDQGIITSIPSLYYIKKEDIASLPGFGDSSANNIIKSINNASIDVLIHKWFGAFPMDDIGSRTWENVLGVLWDNDPTTIINFMNNGDVSKFCHILTKAISDGIIPNVKEATLHRLIDGIRHNWDDMMEVSKFILFKKKQIKQAGVNNNIRVCMTGTRDKTVIDYLSEKGYNIVSFSKSTNVLIVPTLDYISNKVIKAKEMGIPIYDIDSVFKYL